MEPFTMGNRMKSFLAGGLLFLVMLLFTGYAEAGVLGFNPGDLLEKQVLPIVEAQKAAENVADPDKTQDPRGGAQMNHAESGNNNAATGNPV